MRTTIILSSLCSIFQASLAFAQSHEDPAMRNDQQITNLLQKQTKRDDWHLGVGVGTISSEAAQHLLARTPTLLGPFRVQAAIELVRHQTASSLGMGTKRGEGEAAYSVTLIGDDWTGPFGASVLMGLGVGATSYKNTNRQKNEIVPLFDFMFGTRVNGGFLSVELSSGFRVRAFKTRTAINGSAQYPFVVPVRATLIQHL